MRGVDLRRIRPRPLRLSRRNQLAQRWFVAQHKVFDLGVADLAAFGVFHFKIELAALHARIEIKKLHQGAGVAGANLRRAIFALHSDGAFANGPFGGKLAHDAVAPRSLQLKAFYRLPIGARRARQFHIEVKAAASARRQPALG